jgi:hypothetical protein
LISGRMDQSRYNEFPSASLPPASPSPFRILLLIFLGEGTGGEKEKENLLVPRFPASQPLRSPRERVDACICIRACLKRSKCTTDRKTPPDPGVEECAFAPCFIPNSI